MKGVSKPGKYYGVCTGGQLPYGVVYKELIRVETYRGREVRYYDVWIKEKEEKPIFNEAKEPNKQKITLLTRFFRVIFWE